MPQTVEEFVEQTRSLSKTDRRRLGLHLLEDSEAAEDLAFELTPELIAEFDRRIEDYESGRVKGIPWEDVEKDLDSLVDRA